MHRTYFLACIISVSSFAAGQTPQYVLKGTATQLKPDIPGHPDSILWKHNGNKVVEFDGSTQQVFGSYENRITLDWITAELKITDLRSEDSGIYELEVAMMNSYLQTKEYQLEVIDKVTKPTISCEVNKGSSPDESEVQATLLCSAVKPDSLMEFEWRSQGSSTPGDKITFSLKDKEDDEQYTCVVRNPWSSETTTFTVKDCYHEEESSLALIIVLSILALIAVVGTALGILFCKFKQKACFANDKEKQEQPAESHDIRTSQEEPLMSEGKGGNETLPSTQPLRQNDSDNNDDSSDSDDKKQEVLARLTQTSPPHVTAGKYNSEPQPNPAANSRTTLGSRLMQLHEPPTAASGIKSEEHKDTSFPSSLRGGTASRKDPDQSFQFNTGHVNSQANQFEQPETKNEGHRGPEVPARLTQTLPPNVPAGKYNSEPQPNPAANWRTTKTSRLRQQMNEPQTALSGIKSERNKERAFLSVRGGTATRKGPVSGMNPDEHMAAASTTSPRGGSASRKDLFQLVKAEKESGVYGSEPGSTHRFSVSVQERTKQFEQHHHQQNGANRRPGDVDSQRNQSEQRETKNESNKGPVSGMKPDETMEAASPPSQRGGAEDPNQPFKFNRESGVSGPEPGNTHRFSESQDRTSQIKPLMSEGNGGNETLPSTQPLRQNDSDNNDDSSDSDNKKQGHVSSQANQFEQPETKNEGHREPVSGTKSEEHNDTAFPSSLRDSNMFIKTKIGNDQRYVKIIEPSLDEYLNNAFIKFSILPVTEGVRVFDETGTEVNADVFEEVAQKSNAGVFTIRFDTGSQGTAPPSCSSETTTSESLLPEITNSSPLVQSASEKTTIPELSNCSSDDTTTLDEDPSPARKRQKANEDAKSIVEAALTNNPDGDRIIKEYNRTKYLNDFSMRQMLNILAADMTEIYGTSPPRGVRENYAQGIVAMFPSLKDPNSKNGYECFYDVESDSGYLALRLRIIQRKSASSETRGSSSQLTGGGPTARRASSVHPEIQLSEEQYGKAVIFMKYSSNEADIKQKMKMTFGYRRRMVFDEERSSEVLTKFPRFKDIKGLIDQDFVLQFDEDVAARFLEKWPTTFKHKVIQESKALPTTSDLEELIHCAEATSVKREMDDTLASGWDSDFSSILLLLHLIPPSDQGCKRPDKVSASQAEKHLVVFKKSGTSLQEHIDALEISTQPYLLAVGMKRSSIHKFFIILDKHVLPCKSNSSLEAFDELFKAHFVFGTSYNHMLHNMYTFIQTTVYNIDVGKVQESPRVAEFRVRMQN